MDRCCGSSPHPRTPQSDRSRRSWPCARKLTGGNEPIQQPAAWMSAQSKDQFLLKEKLMIVGRVAVMSLITWAGLTILAGQEVDRRWIAEQGVSVVQRSDTIELNGNLGWLRSSSVYSDF